MFWKIFIYFSIFGLIHGKKHVKIFKKPNILFVLADDLGFADLDWKDSNLFTPNLQKYAFANGTAYLANSYVTHLCTPTRASLMTGYYPFRTGTQNGVFLQMEKSGVPPDFPFLTQNLKKVGYKNYLIGKWHLGYCKKEFLPTNRGFDHFYGYYNAQEGYFNHSSVIWNGNLNRVVHGLDLFTEIGGKSIPDRNKNGIYSTHLFTSEAIKILSKHDKNHPFFLFFSHQAVHVPLQVPIQYKRFCNPFLMKRDRHTYCGMLAAMDESFGQIIHFLKRAGFYDNTIVIFSSDNGGDTKAGASNMPLKGQKSSIWEGGTKTTTFVHGPKFITNSGERRDLFHVVDWHATILGMAGMPLEKFGDGLNQWKMLSTGISSEFRRSKFIYNINPPMSALRHDDFKFVYESPDFLIKGRGKSKLFNLRDDPLEQRDISRKHPFLVSMLIDRLFSYQKFSRKSVRTPLDLRGNPEKFKGIFATGWCQ